MLKTYRLYLITGVPRPFALIPHLQGNITLEAEANECKTQNKQAKKENCWNYISQTAVQAGGKLHHADF